MLPIRLRLADGQAVLTGLDTGDGKGDPIVLLKDILEENPTGWLDVYDDREFTVGKRLASVAQVVTAELV